MRNFELRACFAKILQKLDIIDAKVTGMPQVQVQVSDRDLPTFNALRRLGRPATAAEVAAITGNRRARESAKLNEFFRRGLLVKEKQGRKQLFSIKIDVIQQ